MRRIRIAALAAALLLPAGAVAAPCTERAPYAGPPLHAPVAAAIAPGSLKEDALDPKVAAPLDATFERARTMAKAPALTMAAAILGKGLWARTEGAPMLFWASAGKTFTAVAILQLVDEGKIALDDRIDRWVPAAPNAALITVRDLLQHSSGTFSANEDPDWRASGTAMTPEIEDAILARQAPLFCPGAGWRYSNSGYYLLSRILEAVDGRPWRDAIEARIVEPLGLGETRVIRPGDGDGIAPPVTEKGAPVDLSTPRAAGPVAASAADMVRFWAALLEGRLVKPATRDAMFAQLFPGFDATSYYGMGTMALEIPEGAKTTLLLGHIGGAPGVSAIVAWSPADGAIVAAALTGDGPAPAAAFALIRALRAP